MNEQERRAIVESGPVYLANGLRASLAGIMNPDYCTVSSAQPGFWACAWETAKAVCERPDRRFIWSDFLWRVGGGWLGVAPRPEDYQTPEDFARSSSSA